MKQFAENSPVPSKRAGCIPDPGSPRGPDRPSETSPGLPPARRGEIRPRGAGRPGEPGEGPIPVRPDRRGAEELLVRVLGSGPRARAAARRLLEDRDLAGLARCRTRELCRTAGIGSALAARLEAAFELGRRAATTVREPRPSVASARLVWTLLAPRMRGLLQETFVVLLLDGRHRLIRTESVSLGTLTASLVHPREFFRPAIREAAAATIAAHNHPSGDPEPSAEDLEVTRRLVEAGRLLGVPLLDHVVVGDRGWVSLRERMPWPVGG